MRKNYCEAFKILGEEKGLEFISNLLMFTFEGKIVSKDPVIKAMITLIKDDLEETHQLYICEIENNGV